jgi:4-amino-4-deoxy-L-arabinose transferase-like glycosyltransferase
MSAIMLEPPAQTDPKSWLARPIAWRITPAVLLLAGILALSLGLHLYNIQAIGEANTYYTAAVKSMLQSWHNFFFVAAEPGGSVTVDKPPLGLWIEAGFAAVLGVSGFSVTLPNIIAGVLSVWVLYHLVKKYFGTAAGLIAALVLALTPVSLAVDRNNTIDGMLILTLLLAAWAFLRATETGRLRPLLLGAFVVGLGFNIKMLQAFLPLPAFYALYFFGAKAGWRRKIFNLGLATVVLGVVSFAWAVTVDAIPASQRPFVGSTSSNSEMELIFGYNGINRLLGGMDGGRASTGAQPGGANLPNPPANGTFPPGPGGMPPQAPGSSGRPTFPGQNRDGFGGGNGGPGGFDIGQAGVLRFFSAPLAKEMSWLLPFALLAMLLAAFSGRVRLPLISNEHKGLMLWGGWLLTCLVFFSVAGFFHNYYLATLSPALGALVGMGFASLAKLKERSRLLAGAALFAAAGSTLAFQIYLVSQFGLNGAWVGLAAVLLAAAGVLSAANLLRQRNPGVFFRAASGLALAAMLVIPAVWSVRTVSSAQSSMLPEAYAGDGSTRGFALGGFSGGPGGGDTIDTSVLNYLEANTQNIKYLVAVPSSHPGSNLVLQTGRPVLFMGGFTGSDPVVNASSLSRLVADGELRYVLYGGGGPGGGNSDIGSWLANSCQVVSGVGQATAQNFGRMGASTLYQCGI